MVPNRALLFSVERTVPNDRPPFAGRGIRVKSSGIALTRRSRARARESTGSDFQRASQRTRTI